MYNQLLLLLIDKVCEREKFNIQYTCNSKDYYPQCKWKCLEWDQDNINCIYAESAISSEKYASSEYGTLNNKNTVMPFCFFFSMILFNSIA